MKAIFYKELQSFFTNPLGYIIVGVYLVMNALFLWWINNDFNIFESGYAQLVNFFELSSWLFIFIVPAMAMKSFSEEIKRGTIEIIFTQPITTWQLVLGKFLGHLVLGIFALMPSLFYVFSLSQIAESSNLIDYGAIGLGYLGLILLISCFTAISLLTSSFTSNQITSFLVGVITCLVLFYAFHGISTFQLFGSEIYSLEYLSLHYHFAGLSRGVVDTRNVLFMLSVSFLFLLITYQRIEKLKN